MCNVTLWNSEKFPSARNSFFVLVQLTVLGFDFFGSVSPLSSMVFSFFNKCRRQFSIKRLGGSIWQQGDAAEHLKSQILPSAGCGAKRRWILDLHKSSWDKQTTPNVTPHMLIDSIINSTAPTLFLHIYLLYFKPGTRVIKTFLVNPQPPKLINKKENIDGIISKIQQQEYDFFSRNIRLHSIFDGVQTFSHTCINGGGLAAI